MPKDTQKIKEERAEIMLELAIWDVIHEHQRRKATKTESKLTTMSVLYVLSVMISRIVAEVQGYVKR